MFAIPGGAADHQVEAEASFAEDVKVWTMHPHMHLRGKDMTYTAIYPDGREEVVLRVPRFDFGWQTDYWLSQPLTLPKGVEAPRAPRTSTTRRPTRRIPIPPPPSAGAIRPGKR